VPIGCGFLGTPKNPWAQQPVMCHRGHGHVEGVVVLTLGRSDRGGGRRGACVDGAGAELRGSLSNGSTCVDRYDDHLLRCTSSMLTTSSYPTPHPTARTTDAPGH
jgi:hypothetical protein